MVNTTALVLQSEQAVLNVASSVLSGAVLWSARACVYTNAKENCTVMLNVAHEYMQSHWFSVRSISPLYADVQRIGRMLNHAVTNIVTNITTRITDNLTGNMQDLVLRHAIAPVLTSLLRLIKPHSANATDDATNALVEDVLMYIEERVV